MNKTDQMRRIRDAVWNLKESPLYQYRVQNKYYSVIGEGSHNANIMFIGEAPGLNEAKTGRPFCGAAGKVLDKLLESAGIKREEVYITNIVKDRPPENRDPLPEEIAVYAPFLEKQINIIQPKIIVTLGRFSMRYIMDKFGVEEFTQSISQAHGKIFNGKAPFGKFKIIPLYHPAVAVYNPQSLKALEEDFKKILPVTRGE